MKHPQRKRLILPLATGGLVFLAGCMPVEDDDTANGQDDTGTRIQVDASSTTDFRGVNLLTGDTTADLENDTWHIALRRYDGIRLGDGVETAVADAQDAFYNSSDEPVTDTFVNATADMYAADLTYPYDLSGLTFEAQSFGPAFGTWEDWGTYRTGLPADRQGGGYVTATADQYRVVTSSEGDYFALSLAANDTPLFDTRNGAFTDARITLAITAEGNDNGFDPADAVTTTGDVPAAPDTIYLDLDADTPQWSDTQMTGWDLEYGVELSRGTGGVGVLRTNGGITGDGGVAVHQDAPFDASGLADVDSSVDMFGRYFSEKDARSNLFTENAWFEYGVNGGHRMWPNFRVYAVDTDGDTDTTDDVVMVQAINYYHPDSGESGHITLKTRASDDN